MKPLLILLSIAICLSAGAQVKNELKGQSTANSKLLIGNVVDYTASYFSISNNTSKPYMTIHGSPTWNNPDSLLITVNKKLTYWKNDSTLIIKKPKQ